MVRGLDFIPIKLGNYWRVLAGERHDLICIFERSLWVDYMCVWGGDAKLEAGRPVRVPLQWSRRELMVAWSKW